MLVKCCDLDPGDLGNKIHYRFAVETEMNHRMSWV